MFKWMIQILWNRLITRRVFFGGAKAPFLLCLSYIHDTVLIFGNKAPSIIHVISILLHFPGFSKFVFVLSLNCIYLYNTRRGLGNGTWI